MRQIELHGELAEKFGAIHHYNVKNASEAIRALCANHKDFQKHLIESKFHYGVLTGPSCVGSEDELFYPVGKKEIIHIVPQIAGAKSGLQKIFVGAVLVAAAYFGGPAAAGSLKAFALGATQAVGVGLVLQGVSQLIAEHKKKEKEKNDTSFGPTNSTRQGVPVPLGYGRMVIGSITIAQMSVVRDATEVDDWTYWTEPSVENQFTSQKTTIVRETNLDSKANIHTIELLCEGEIEGLVDEYKSVYLNETPVENSTGKANFKKVGYGIRTGTNSQSRFSNPANSGYTSAEAVPVGQDLLQGIDNIYTISDTNADQVELIFGAPTFYKQENDGDLVGTKAAINIYLQAASGHPLGSGYHLYGIEVLKGKSTTHYQRTRVVRLLGNGPWDIKVVRETADSTPTNVRSVYLESYNILFNEPFRYPNTALVHLNIPSKLFSSLPSRSFDMKMKKIQIPSNATVRSDGSLTYSGSWDGTFQTAWSANPAWIFYDILLNSRYGCGDFIDSDKIDKWSLYTVGQYCDELVPNGFGSTEPRFTCNILITEREDAYKLLNQMASIFRGMVYWSTGQAVAVQDSPSDAVYLFNNTNVAEGFFQYEGSSLQTRHSVAVVAWRDPANLYKQKIEVIEDREAISLFGVRQLEIEATGCTSRGQAQRVGKWALYAEQNETDVVTFKTGIEGAAVRPFNIIKVADSMRAGARFGGRISSATTTTITVDDTAISPSVISGSKISVMLADGTVEQRNVVSYVGDVFTVSSAFTSAPNAQALWVLEPTNVDAQYFRVLSVKESDGFYEISAVSHNPSKYSHIDYNNTLEPLDYTLLDEVPAEPEGLVVNESLYASGSQVLVKATLSFSPVAGAQKYLIEYQGLDDSLVQLPEQFSTSVEIFDLKEGEYTFFVTAISPLGKKSPVAEKDQTIYGKISPPIDVSNFSLVPVERMALLQWDLATDLDVLIGGFVRVRYTPLTSGQSWTDSVDVGPLLAGNTTQYSLPLLEGTYLIKFIDSSGNISANASQIVTTMPSAFELNVVDTQIEEPTFSGSHLGTLAYGPLNALTLATDVLIDSITDFDSLSSLDWFGSVNNEGTYTFANTVDLGDVYTSRVTAAIESSGFNIGNKIDDITELMDAWSTFDGSDFDDVNATLFMRTTEDNPSGSPTWTDWKPFLIADYKARGFQFKVKLTSADSTHNIAVSKLQVSIDMPDRIENHYDKVSGAGAYNLVYNFPFKATPTVGITAKNMATGDFFVLSGESSTGCTVHFKNSGGSSVSRTFNAIVRGYGKQL